MADFKWEDFRSRLPSRGTVFRVLSISFGVALLLVLVTGIYVYRQSVGRFQLRRLSLPTRIYADYTPLRAGVAMAQDDLLEKLDRLGYRETENPAEAGEYSKGGGGVTIFARPFRHP